MTVRTSAALSDAGEPLGLFEKADCSSRQIEDKSRSDGEAVPCSDVHPKGGPKPAKATARKPASKKSPAKSALKGVKKELEPELIICAKSVTKQCRSAEWVWQVSHWR